jgi:hypothetical protein
MSCLGTTDFTGSLYCLPWAMTKDSSNAIIIKEGCIRFNKPDLVNFCYGILNAAGYGIYFNFKANGDH